MILYVLGIINPWASMANPTDQISICEITALIRVYVSVCVLIYAVWNI